MLRFYINLWGFSRSLFQNLIAVNVIVEPGSIDGKAGVLGERVLCDQAFWGNCAEQFYPNSKVYSKKRAIKAHENIHLCKDKKCG